jgi:hypothetical protein
MTAPSTSPTALIGTEREEASHIPSLHCSVMLASRLESKVVLSNCTPYHTFLELLPGGPFCILVNGESLPATSGRVLSIMGITQCRTRLSVEMFSCPMNCLHRCMSGLSRDSGWVGEDSPLPRDFVHHIRFADYSSGVFKVIPFTVDSAA